jgi:hypothetical protein
LANVRKPWEGSGMIKIRHMDAPHSTGLFGRNMLSAVENGKLIHSTGFREIINQYLSKSVQGKCAAICGQKTGKADRSISPEMMMKVDAAVKWLAGYLGIKPSFLLAVFNGLGLDPNDMADQKKLAEIINKLAEHFNLDKEQKKEVLEKMSGILGFGS